jgi:hypothetical protein
MTNIRYVDDPFEDVDWKFPVNDFERRVLAAVGRKYFDTQENARKLRTIAKRVQAQSPPYPIQYVDLQIEWARKKNMNRVGTIKLSHLLSAIKNPDNIARFNNENGQVSSGATDYTTDQGW